MFFFAVFVSLVFFLAWSFGVFSAYFPGFLRVRNLNRKVREILGVFEVFLCIFKKTKEKKDRAEFRFESPLFSRQN